MKQIGENIWWIRDLVKSNPQWPELLRFLRYDLKISKVDYFFYINEKENDLDYLEELDGWTFSPQK